MSAALDLLQRIHAAGGTVQPEGNRLKLRAPQPLPPDLVDELRLHKADLLAALQSVPLDEHGLPYQPCRCGSHYFWRPVGGTWHCYDCHPYTDATQSMTTCTLSHGIKLVAENTRQRCGDFKPGTEFQ